MAKEKVTKELQTVPENGTVMSTFHSADLIIQKMAEKGMDLDKVEKMLEIKGKYEAEENKKKFHREFAKMQADLPVIKTTKDVRVGGTLVYSYAPLEKIIQQIKPVLCKYGFSYKWSEGFSEDKSNKRIHCHIMAHGHEESSFVDIPIMDATKMTNRAQQAGSSSTYGKRYSLIGALGIMADADDDGGSLTDEKQEHINTELTPFKEEIIPKLREGFKVLNYNTAKTIAMLNKYLHTEDPLQATDSNLQALYDEVNRKVDLILEAKNAKKA